MATLVPQDMVKSGELEASYAACTGGGDVCPNDGKIFLHVKNGHSSPQTVTIAAVGTTKDFGGEDGPYTRASIAVVVTNAEERFIGPFPKRAFNNSSGQIAITYSGVTLLTIAAVRYPK